MEKVGGGAEASGRHGEPGYLDLPLRVFLGLLADDQPAPAGGAAAALGVALAASLCAMAARLSGRQLPEAAELAAEAGRLADTVAPLSHGIAQMARFCQRGGVGEGHGRGATGLRSGRRVDREGSRPGRVQQTRVIGHQGG